MAEKKKMRSEASSSNSGTSSGGNNRGESVVVDVGRRRSSCGYCRSGGRTSISHGLWAQSLTVDDYQALLDKGWRRSGCFMYKPEMERTCCPSYTIRMKASDFLPSKEQLRVSKRMQRFLDGSLVVKKSDELMEDSNTSKDSCGRSHHESTSSAVEDPLTANREEKSKEEQFLHFLSDQIDTAVCACGDSREFPCDIQLPKASVKKVAPAKKKLLVKGTEDLLYSSNISFQMAAVLRRAAKDVHLLKLSSHGAEENGQFTELTPKVIAEKLANYLKQLEETSGLLIRACNGHINFYSTKRQAWLDDIVGKGTVSKESPQGSGGKENLLKKSSGCLPGKKHRLEIHLKRSTFDPEEYALYRTYQLKVHNDTPERVTESSYRRFLVDTPLIFVPSSGDGTVPPCGFGSFHQQYVLDGRVVAVGVIDILPMCLSSKYLFWDPDLAILSLGKYSALQEISWVKENQVHCPSLQYYYLGYYIHSCNKMRYKAAYHPSELLCPLRYEWVLFDVAKPLLDRKPYVVLSDFSTLQDGVSVAPSHLQDHMELEDDDSGQEESHGFPIDDDDEMAELDDEDSDYELGPETSCLTPLEIAGGDVGNILIGLKGSHLRYKELQQAFGPIERSYLETQLQRYMSAVGAELSERMVYSLG
ncbi:unnamed protein product [Ilex paraguariensis]|uniref:arginyltransferase n=1 Tax=Ilex paraguariensis TaxID=185542 RepID=A0ABC8U0I1_9AQUA